MAQRSVPIPNGADGFHFRVHLAALAPVPDFAVPVAIAHQAAPHGLEKSPVVPTAAEHARVFPQYLVTQITGDAGEGVIHIDHITFGVGDDDPLPRMGEHTRGQLERTGLTPQPSQHPQAIGHEGQSGDQQKSPVRRCPALLLVVMQPVGVGQPKWIALAGQLPHDLWQVAFELVNLANVASQGLEAATGRLRPLSRRHLQPLKPAEHIPPVGSRAFDAVDQHTHEQLVHLVTSRGVVVKLTQHIIARTWQVGQRVLEHRVARLEPFQRILFGDQPGRDHVQLLHKVLVLAKVARQLTFLQIPECRHQAAHECRDLVVIAGKAEVQLQHLLPQQHFFALELPKQAQQTVVLVQVDGLRQHKQHHQPRGRSDGCHHAQHVRLAH